MKEIKVGGKLKIFFIIFFVYEEIHEEKTWFQALQELAPTLIFFKNDQKVPQNAPKCSKTALFE